MMPPIYIKKNVHEEIVRRGYDVNKFVEEAIREKIKKNETRNNGEVG